MSEILIPPHGTYPLTLFYVPYHTSPVFNAVEEAVLILEEDNPKKQNQGYLAVKLFASRVEPCIQVENEGSFVEEEVKFPFYKKPQTKEAKQQNKKENPGDKNE